MLFLASIFVSAAVCMNLKQQSLKTASEKGIFCLSIALFHCSISGFGITLNALLDRPYINMEQLYFMEVLKVPEVDTESSTLEVFCGGT